MGHWLRSHGRGLPVWKLRAPAPPYSLGVQDPGRGAGYGGRTLTATYRRRARRSGLRSLDVVAFASIQPTSPIAGQQVSIGMGLVYPAQWRPQPRFASPLSHATIPKAEAERRGIQYDLVHLMHCIPKPRGRRATKGWPGLERIVPARRLFRQPMYALSFLFCSQDRGPRAPLASVRTAGRRWRPNRRTASSGRSCSGSQRAEHADCPLVTLAYAALVAPDGASADDLGCLTAFPVRTGEKPRGAAAQRIWLD